MRPGGHGALQGENPREESSHPQPTAKLGGNQETVVTFMPTSWDAIKPVLVHSRMFVRRLVEASSSTDQATSSPPVPTAGMEFTMRVTDIALVNPANPTSDRLHLKIWRAADPYCFIHGKP